MTAADATVPVVVARAIFAAAERRGLSASVLAEAVGFDLELLDAVDARAPAGIVARLWDEAGKRTGDESFGLDVGRTSPDAGLPLAGRLIAASDTLGEGLARVMTYYRVFNDVHPAEVAVDGDELVVRVLTKAIPIKLPRHAIEFAFSWFVAVASKALREPVKLTRVSFEHAAPKDDAEHREWFGCPVTFDAGETSFRAPATLFERRTASPDPELLEILERHAQNLFEKLPARASLVARTRAVLVELLPRGDADIELTAEALQVSARTLQRKLQEEGTSFRDLVDDTRAEIAKERLRDLSLSIAEVALRVGFSDQSAFHRAFVRWTGATPGDFRKGIRR